MTEGTAQLRVFGLDAVVTAVPDEAAERLRAQWEWCLPGSALQRTLAPLSTFDGDPPSEPLSVERLTEGENTDADAADYRLTTAITGAAIEARRGQYLMLHAAGICDQATGRVAALVAASGTGKTTATRYYCGSEGYGYVTDETLIFNDAREVLPYPKPLSVVIDPASPYTKSQHGPRELGFVTPPPGTLEIGPFLLLDRIRPSTDDADAVENGDGAAEDGNAHPVEPPAFERVNILEGLSAILPQSSAMPDIPGCLDLLARLASASGGIHRLTYREISETTPLLRRAFDLPPVEPDWIHVPGTWPRGEGAATPYNPPLPDPNPTPITSDVIVEREIFVDALVREEDCEALVLAGATTAHLRGIGALVWTETESPRTCGELLRLCVEAFGEHPDAPDLLADCLDQLRQSRVLIITAPDGGLD